MKFTITVKGEKYILEEGSLTIGRGKNADISISSEGLSRLHARFSVKGSLLKIEDLESRNGTFVNHKKLQGTIELRAGDTVRCGDILCTISASEETVATKPVHDHDKGRKKEEPETKEATLPKEEKEEKDAGGRPLLINAAALAVIAGAVIAFIVMLKGEPGVEDARSSIEEARQVFREVEPLSRLSIPKKLINGIEKIDATVEMLERISPAFQDEYAQAHNLIDLLKKVKGDIADRVISLQGRESMKSRYERIMKRMKNNEVSGHGAVQDLRDLAGEMTGTIYEKIYEHKAESLKQQIIEDTRRGLRKRIEDAELMCQEGRFGDAVRSIEAKIGNPYTESYADIMEDLTKARKRVRKRFRNSVLDRERGWIADAELGQCSIAEEKVKKAFEDWNVPGSKVEKERILARIDKIRTRLLQESAENIKEDMDRARSDLNKRFYTKASRRFSDLLRIVGNEDLREYIDRNRKIATLLQNVKERIIAALNANGLPFTLVAGSEGEIVKADNEKFYLKLQTDTVGFKWGVLQDHEFASVITAMLPNDGEAQLGAGILLHMLDERLGRKEIDKAAGLRPELKKEYPWIFSNLVPSFNEKDVKAAIRDLKWKDTPVIYDKRASNAGTAEVGEPTLVCLDVRWQIRGDANCNALVTMEFRKKNTGRWKHGVNLFPLKDRTDKDMAGGRTRVYAGSIFDLKPGTDYEIRLRVRDPDGGRAERRIKASTLPKPAPYAEGHVRHVVPEGNPSTEFSNRFKGFEFAQLAAQPGDTVLVYEGTYPGLIVTKSGSEGKPIVYKAAGDGEVVIDGEGGRTAIYAKNVSHIIFENLTVKNAYLGMDINGASDIAVKGCRFSECACCISGQINDSENIMKRFCITDSTFTGPVAWPMSDEAETVRAVQIAGVGHTVCYNRISGWGSGIGMFPSSPVGSIDIYNNDISECTAEGIEADYSESNVRIFRNRMINCGSGISVQNVRGGPVYAVRNVMYNIQSEFFKVRRGSSGVVILHNTCVKKGTPLFISGGPLYNMVFKNNIFIGTKSLFAVDFTLPLEECFMDYNGYGGTWNTFAKFGTIQYPSINRFRETEEMEIHGLVLKDTAIFGSGTKPPSDIATAYKAEEVNLMPASSSPCADAGCMLPNINDGYSGAAPDLGAYEQGEAIPRYGPRTGK